MGKNALWTISNQWRTGSSDKGQKTRKMTGSWKSTSREFLKSHLPIPVAARLRLRSHRKVYQPSTNPARERNYITAQQDYVAKRIFVRSLPFFAGMDSCNFCNLRCWFCHANNGEYSISNPKVPKVHNRERCCLDLEKYALVLEAFGETLFSINLTSWAEPFLNRNIFTMVSMAKKRNIEVRFSTNPNIKDPGLAQKICECELDALGVSIDGLRQETYEKYRRGGNFEVLIQNLRKIAAYKKKYRPKKPELIWKFLVFRHNEHEIPFVEEFAHSHGADSVRISGADIYHEGWIPGSKEYPPLGPRFENICNYLWTTATIEATGSLSPCCTNRDYRYDLGEFTTAQKLRELWNGDRIRALRNYCYDRKPNSKIVCDMCLLMKHDVKR